MKIRELLSDESKWTKGSYARHINGNSIGPRQDNACSWCLLGSIYKCYGFRSEFFRSKFFKVFENLRIKLKGNDITAWNDAPERTFEDVKKLVEELDI